MVMYFPWMTSMLIQMSETSSMLSKYSSAAFLGYKYFSFFQVE